MRSTLMTLILLSSSNISCSSNERQVGVEYVYVHLPKKFVGIKHGKNYSIGKLDAAGNFIPDKDWLDIEVGAPLMHSPGGSIVNLNPYPKKTYEFRSRRLVLGIIDEDGSFIPDLESNVITLEEYLKHYDPLDKDVSPIYNLPGKITRKGEENYEEPGLRRPPKSSEAAKKSEPN